jgi:AcrR family transcriptional regulator
MRLDYHFGTGGRQATGVPVRKLCYFRALADRHPPTMRSDGKRNREQIVAAARSALGEVGLAVSAEEIARRAGVSIATLYRHFPDRNTLLSEVLEKVLEDWSALLQEALAHEDPWDGLVWFFEQLGEISAANPTFSELSWRLASTSFPASHAYLAMWKDLLSRAQAEGALRSDVTYADVGFLTTSLTMIVSVTENRLPGFWRRHLRLLLDGLQAPAQGLPDLAVSGTLEEALAHDESPSESGTR